MIREPSSALRLGLPRPESGPMVWLDVPCQKLSWDGQGHRHRTERARGQQGWQRVHEEGIPSFLVRVAACIEVSMNESSSQEVKE